MAKHVYAGGGWAGVKSKASGFFRVEEIDGRWWVIDPAGEGFFVVGTDHVNYHSHRCEALGYAPYHRNCQAKYGSEEAWAAEATRRLRAWGFNNVGAGCGGSVRHRGLTHTEFVSFGHGYAKIDPIAPRRWWTGFPNVFGEGFVKYCDGLARKLCRPNRSDPWLLGYFLDNELEWYGSYGEQFGQFDVGSSLLTDAFVLPADNAARKAAERLLRSRHTTPAAINRAWGTRLASLRELSALTSLPRPQTPQAHEDVLAYLRLCAEEYFAVTTKAIHRHDPNHMVLGCRFAGSARGFMDVVGKYCDIVSINCYRFLDLGLGRFIDGFEQELEAWHAQARRPLMITEWSFPALDADLPCRNGGGQRVPTQRDKAAAFRIFQTHLFGRPFVVGSNYFMWSDEPALGVSRSFPEDCNYGLVNEHDEPYTLLTQAAMNLNPRVYAIHSGNGEAKVFVTLWPDRPGAPAASQTFTLTAASELDEPVEGAVRLAVVGAHGSVAPREVRLAVPPRGEVRQKVIVKAGGDDFSIRITSACPRIYGLKYDHLPRRVLRVPAGPPPRRVTPAWLKAGAPITVDVEGQRLLTGSIRIAGGRLHIHAQVADAAPRVNRAVPWDGSCIEVFFKQPAPLTLLRQFYLMPDLEAPALWDLACRPVAGSTAAIAGTRGGYVIDASAPLDALGVPHAEEAWCMDLVATAAAFGDRGRSRAAWSGGAESHSRWSHYVVIVPTA